MKNEEGKLLLLNSEVSEKWTSQEKLQEMSCAFFLTRTVRGNKIGAETLPAKIKL